MTLDMNYPNGYDPTTTAALIQNPVQPLSQAQAQPPSLAGAALQHQQHQPLLQQHHPQQAQQHHPHHHQQQHPQQPPQAHRLVRPGHTQVFLGQQPLPHQQQWHPVQPPAAPPSAAPPPSSIAGPQPYHEAHSPSPQPRQHPEQRPAQHSHPSYNPLPPSTAAFEPSSLGLQGLQQPEPSPAQRPHYGGNPTAGMPYGAPTGRMPLGGPTMYPAKQPTMTGHQSPYTGAPYVRTSPHPPGMTPYAASQPSTGPPSVHGTSPGPPSHQPYPTVTPSATPAPPSVPAGAVTSQPQPMSVPPAPQHQPPPPQQQQGQPPLARHPQQQQQQQQPPPSQQRHMSVSGSASQTPRPSVASAGKPPASSPGSQRIPSQPPLSPASMERERERVAVLLQINTELLKEVVQMQADGKSGPSAKTEPGDERDGVDGSTKGGAPHPEFIDCMRCLQSNLAYLAALADRAHKPTSTVPPSPAIMVAPRCMPSLVDLYRQLAALFPGAPSADSPGNASARGASSPFTGQVPASAPTPGSTAAGPILTPEATMPDGTGRPGPPPHARSGSIQAEQYKRWLGEMGGPSQPGFEGFEQLQHTMPLMQPNGQTWEHQMAMNAMNAQLHPAAAAAAQPSGHPPPPPAFQ